MSVRVDTPATTGTVGLCLDPMDLAAAKLAAGRETDLEFVGAMLSFRLVSGDALATHLIGLPEPYRALAIDRLKRLR